MSNATVTLIPTTTFGGPVGNYDGNSATFSSNISQGDGYYGSSDGLHSVSYSVTNFLGNIDIEGSLAQTPGATDWFTVFGTTLVGTGVGNLVTTSTNFVGNFVWVRANVSAFSQGTINKVLFNRS